MRRLQTPLVPQGGAYLTVSWTIFLPRKTPYFIGMYLENDDVTQTVPIKYIMVGDGKNEPGLKVADTPRQSPPLASSSNNRTCVVALPRCIFEDAFP